MTLECGEANYSPTPSPSLIQSAGRTPASLTPASQTPVSSLRASPNPTSSMPSSSIAASQTSTSSLRASPYPTSLIPSSSVPSSSIPDISIPESPGLDKSTDPTSFPNLDQITGDKPVSSNGPPASSSNPSQATGDKSASSNEPASSLNSSQATGDKYASSSGPISSSNPSQDIGDSFASVETSRSRSLIVSSDVLRLSSRSFEAMLKPGSREGVKFLENGFVVISLPEDSSEAMMAICNAIHGREAFVDNGINVSLLHDIAVLSDKYDLNQALEPTATRWVRDYVSHLGESPARQSRIDIWTDVLRSAYLFRHQKLAHKAIEGLVLCTYPTTRGINARRYRIPDKLLSKLQRILSI